MILLSLLLSGALLASVGLNLLLYKSIQRTPRERERERNVWAARESELLDRIMHMSGSTWTPPPRPAPADEEPDEEYIKRLQEGWEEA